MTAVDIKCPECNRWLAEADGYACTVCPNCGWEIQVRDKQARIARDRKRVETGGQRQ